jgi:hypothetical protein
LVLCVCSCAEGKTPGEIYFDRLQAETKRQGAEGSYTVEGIPRADGEEEEEEEEEEDEDVEKAKSELKKLNAEQVACLRHIIITPRREKLLEDVRVDLFPESDEGFMMTNTASSYPVIAELKTYAKELPKVPDVALRFDMVLAVTINTFQFDFWMADTDIPTECQSVITKLAGLWKKLLPLTAKETGCDEEFSKKGVLAFLTRFKNTAKDYGYKFNFE